MASRADPQTGCEKVPIDTMRNMDKRVEPPNVLHQTLGDELAGV